MILTQLLTALTHVTSQLVGRWIPPPAPLTCGDFGHNLARVCDLYCRSGVAGLDEAAWAEVLSVDRFLAIPQLKGLLSILKKQQLTHAKVSEAAARHFSDLTNAGGTYLSIYDWNYPSLLRQIARPPLGLSVLGNIELITRTSVSVIGSRRTSYAALKASVEVGLACARMDMPVVSGGALGCDIAVHEGMLAHLVNPVGAVVVMAGGLNRLFPRANLRTFMEIIHRGGVLISERLWYQDVRPHDFPSRNRLVSGMSATTVVMAAASRSGSLITAMEALDQGRDVFVFAGVEGDVRFDGSERLLEDGATPFLSATELIANLGISSAALP